MTVATEILDHISRVVGHKGVFAPPFTDGDVTVIAAATVIGGGGGGGGGGDEEEEEVGDRTNSDGGDGGGFGVVARPAGALVISGGKVRWKPTIDLNRVILGGQALGIAYFVATWLIERSRAKATVKVAQAAADASDV